MLLRISLSILLSLLLFFSFTPSVWAFCGFFVAKADASLYNKASQVIIARDGDRTILTMANDYQGDVKDFALVVPVPTVLKQEQVRVGDRKIIDKLDTFTAPRLVEYFDEDPCAPPDIIYEAVPALPGAGLEGARTHTDSLGVTIEARFSVGEYDILILSARESDGLETWLIQNGYKIPRGASSLLQPYIRQNMKFFVARVNLKEFTGTGTQFLRPLMIAYESPRFMLPIRLGMINAQADQDLLVYLLTPRGRAEVTNYRMVRLPTDSEIPTFVKKEFGNFYKAMYETAHRRSGGRAVFLEYAWDVSNCDPCTTEPPTLEELKQAGVFWLDHVGSAIVPRLPRPVPIRPTAGVFVTRIHVRYNRNNFPEDLMFKETPNQELFQGRYVLRHPFTGRITCEAGKKYQENLKRRWEQEARTLAKLTSWDINEIRRKMQIAQTPPTTEDAFWRRIWK
ncbi:MAG: DUF2330 domain-containing protein [Pseudanabaenaceae cyanobacterium]